MTPLESAGLRLRPMRRVDSTFVAEDLDAAADLCAAAELAAIGVVETGRPELLEWLTLRIADLDTSGLILRGETWIGFVWAYNDVTARETFAVIFVPPQVDAADIRAAVVQHCVDAARRHRETAGQQTWTLRIRQWLDDADLGQSLAEAGFTPVRRFHRMRIDSTSQLIPEATPPLPEGVEFVVARSEAERREVHLVDDEAFADHWNHTSRTWDEWWGEFEESPSMDEDGWWLLRVNGDPAAILIMEDTLTDRNLGYVGVLAVRRPYRGKGLATYLLQRSFVRYRDMGRDGIQLGVDAESLTGAVRLYETVGMRAVLTSQAWTMDLD